ncbi:MAG: GGDEF domain-containing protein [Gammaproteobacteria bacterium]|nr:GGDEF domain-containing protein [Gammaproteobacteria bacterium]
MILESPSRHYAVREHLQLAGAVFAASAGVIAAFEFLGTGSVHMLMTVAQGLIVAAIITGIALPIVQRAGRASDDSMYDSRRVDGSDRPTQDPVTRTLNSHGITIKILEHLALAERYGREFSIAMVGIDDWHRIHAQHGSSVGARVLEVIADAIVEAVRMPDRVGRYAENEFLVVMPETHADGANQILERLRTGIMNSKLALDSPVSLTVTISVGITGYRHGDDLQELLLRVGDATDQAQQQGCNRVIVKLAA